MSVSGLPANPTQAQLTTAWQAATELTEVFNRASIFDSTNGKNWTYFDNTEAWEVTGEVGQSIAIENFSQGQAGLVVGDNQDGKVYAEQDGTGSVYGWDALKSRVTNTESNITTLDTDKQDKLTAGTNITIDQNTNTISASGGTLYSTTGTNVDGAMTQLATSNLIYPSGYETSKTKILIGNAYSSSDYAIAIGTTNGTSAANTADVAIGRNASASGTQAIAIGGAGASNTERVKASGAYSIAIGGRACDASGSYSIAIGGHASDGAAKATNAFSTALGALSVTSRDYELSIGNSTTTRYIANVTDPQLAQDAATKNYTDSLAISYAALSGSAAPTTSTEGKYIGQMYYDTANEQLYFLKEIDDTDPNNVEYTWEAVGSGGGSSIPTDATFWGASYNNASNSVSGNLNLGGNIIHSGTFRPSIGSNSYIGFTGANQPNISGAGSCSMFWQAPSSSNERTILQIRGTTAGQRVQFQGASTAQTLRLSGVTDPTDAQDAATKNYVDTAVASAGAATYTTGEFNNIWQEA